MTAMESVTGKCWFAQVGVLTLLSTRLAERLAGILTIFALVGGAMSGVGRVS